MDLEMEMRKNVKNKDTIRCALRCLMKASLLTWKTERIKSRGNDAEIETSKRSAIWMSKKVTPTCMMSTLCGPAMVENSQGYEL
jgi:hypothetical protein